MRRPFSGGRWVWVFLSMRGMFLRLAARFGGKRRLSIAFKACASGEGFMRPPWPKAPILQLQP
ncbi:unnamed protein product [Discosporangium mesarthrocarpum]